jgi:predicted nucleic acid-binding protein
MVDMAFFSIITRLILSLNSSSCGSNIDLLSVALMSFDVLNSLRYAPNISLVNLIEVAESMEKLSLDLRMLEGGLSWRTMENAQKYGITIYDLGHLSLGEIENTPVYTADEK